MYYIHLSIYRRERVGCLGVQCALCVCIGQKTAGRNWFFLSFYHVRLQALNQGCQVWQQGPLPTEPSHQPCSPLDKFSSPLLRPPFHIPKQTPKTYLYLKVSIKTYNSWDP